MHVPKSKGGNSNKSQEIFVVHAYQDSSPGFQSSAHTQRKIAQSFELPLKKMYLHLHIL